MSDPDAYDDFHGAEDAQEEVIEPQYRSVTEWVEEWLTKVYIRPIEDEAQFRWDPQWWNYLEVVIRLEALWGSYEKMRLEGGPGMVQYFRDYLDPMMNVILSPTGPFFSYKAHKVTPDGPRPDMPAPLPVSYLPEGWLGGEEDVQ